MKLIRRLILLFLVGPLLLVGMHMLLFRVLPVPVTPLMLLRWHQGHGIEKRWVDIDEMSPHLPRAVIASEDNRFCVHQGVDWSAVKTVVNEYREDGRLRGASTISMQTVKNLYLWPGRNVIRKALEAGLVHVLEWSWPKERILEVYLNVVEMGPGVYGVQAAAQHHFGRDSADLSFVQSASLAAILPDPLHRDPTRKNKAMGMRVQRIRTTLAGLGPLLECVPAAPELSAPTREERIQAPVRPNFKRSDGLGAPEHFQTIDAEAQDQATPDEPWRGKNQKVRSKRRRRSR